VSTALISAAGAMAGAVAMVVVYLLSKKHKEHIEDQETETNHVTAIAAASKTLAAAVNVLIEPLNNSIAVLQERERAMAIEMTKMKAELAVVKADHKRMHRDLESLVMYVRLLWQQIKDFGGSPLPPPDELAHVVWDDDPDTYFELPDYPT
jgi:hypothetical protein